MSSYGYGSGGSGGSTGSILSSGYAYDSGGSSGAYGATYSAPSYVQSYAVEVYSQPDCFEPVVTVDPVVDSLDCDDCVVEESTGIIDHGSTDQGVMIESDGNIEEPAVIDGVESVPADRDEGKAQHPEARMRNSGMLVLNVPDSATVFVNGYKTSSTGALRRMMSSGLEPGHSYSYEVRVVDGGQAVTKVASLTAGQTLNLSFDLQENADSRTVVTLDVPNDAKVKLAGSAMKQTGSHRVFATDRLSPGESWDDYVVQVTIERDGRTLTQQRKLNVRGGESYELTFDFEEGRLASL